MPHFLIKNIEQDVLRKLYLLLTAFFFRLTNAASVTRFGILLYFVQLFKPFATINLPKSSTVLGNSCKGVKINHFSSEIIFGQLL